ncbi:PREDICTED: jasmonic acid-amido synthetase JAR1-like [Nelumbo nucifera]|uniref:Jasmonic acid-amido synthetase JAR1-like n=1 Tax=Nelumbo nucifera TaxID=4432 RepID=A0A1U8A8R1_NELNU|nr:PREDICTED: jasmonic acid-amido synthetase JAR1-like [Nelumbo nucifera]XP_010261499.1 PREDICTED: jasmonic acid-amido synthetase JAR1-like [Nelumbo nucifera]XP_010261500.1 PREDICTED: jasmonic acid-amido synthetase JAR1-like [Nelumbo nucifera]XP_010261501.1 PREDICTED: jasmonic acid-amido synthetase JAR1-like [Nelumbo nucifera]
MLENMEQFDYEKVIEEFEELTKDVGRVQIETLKWILEENREAEYLQNLGLNGRTDPESFKACVPLVTHKDLESYIQRIADGDDSPILTGKPITTISLSSGTTQGRPKFVPFNEELMRTTIRIYETSFAFRNREFPVGNGKALQLIYSSKQFKTKGGLAAGTATTNVFRSQQFKKTLESIRSQCCSPDEVIFGPDFHQSLYCHLLCGLIYRDEVELVSSTFAHSIVFAFRTFEQVWEELCDDIRTGVLSNRIAVPSIRTALSKLLKPNPELADLIHNKCSGLSNWYGLIPELFPNVKYIYGIMTGSMEPYLKKLRHYAGGLPLLSSDYGSSEGWIAANVNPRLPPESATFAVLPDIGYFEFIPLREKEDQSLDITAVSYSFTEAEPIGLAEVKIGEEYEIILTNFAGLYRYRLGDVVKVVGFHNSTPELQFVCRRNLLLNINIDKNTEKDLQLAVETAGKLLLEEKVEVIDFTSHVDLSTDPGHYVIFWELSNGVSDAQILNECCNCLDRSFVDAGYVSSRKVNGIGALELRVVRRGTFQKILDHYLGLGSAVSQFKTPRCVGQSNNTVLQILCNNVVNKYFSTAFC